MVLGIGLISAFIIAKKNNKKTRLEKLQEKLQKKPMKTLSLYEIPTKKLFIISFITLFICFLGFFQQNYQMQLLISHGSPQQLLEDLQNVSKAIFVVKTLNIIMMIGVVADLRFKVLKVRKDINEIDIGESSVFFWKTQKMKIGWNSDEQLVWQIVRMGDEKFSQNTNRYGIKMINVSKKVSKIVLERGDIFHARKSLIQLSSILNFQLDLRLH